MSKNDFYIGGKMKKVFWGTILLAAGLLLPVSAVARVDVGISISLPPLVLFAGPPELVVLPESNVYVPTDLDVEMFFYEGWWWRPWQGRWYRSRNYNSGWGYYRSTPSFYRGIPANWRNDFREGRWKGHQWDRQQIPHEQVQDNWRNWEKNRHWEKENSWGVRDLRRQKDYRQRKSEVRQPQRRVQPQPRQAEPQHRNVQQQSRPQSREAVKPQPSHPRNERDEKEGKEKHGRN